MIIHLLAKSKIENRGKHLGEKVATSEEIVQTLGETYGNAMGNGRKWLGNWGNIRLRESP